MNNVSQRINRIVGQLRGIEKMVKNNRSCEEILQQINAIKKAIDGLSKEILVSDICRIVPKEKTEEVKKIVERAISL
jgi:DNA-binding FrmR family transcriptional regulator